MNRLIIIISVLFISANSFGQIQRNSTINNANDSSVLITNKNWKEGKGKKQMFQELDLTKEQRGQLKTIRQDAKAKREAIENDDSISDKEQKEKLKALRKETDEAIQKILTKEQWKKFVEQREKKLNNAE